MFGKKKSRLGIQPKIRTRKEIDQEYTHHAVQIGHKARVVSQLQDEIDDHVKKLIVINAEAMKLPPEEPEAAPTHGSTEPPPPPAPSAAPAAEGKTP